MDILGGRKEIRRCYHTNKQVSIRSPPTLINSLGHDSTHQTAAHCLLYKDENNTFLLVSSGAGGEVWL